MYFAEIRQTNTIYEWINLFAAVDMPFNWLNNPVFMKAIKYESVSFPTLKKYMNMLGTCIANNVQLRFRYKNGILKPIALLLDMWDNGTGII